MNGPFVYPVSHVRRHGPVGYAEHARYRPWLRDEFAFRCVYCLTRETWGSVTGMFDVDHFVPVAVRPDAALDYENLVFACRRCNGQKGGRTVPNPLSVLVPGAVRVLANGELETDTPEAALLADRLDLQRAELTDYRRLVLDTIRLAELYDHDLFVRWMGFPSDLPDRSKLNPPSNTRPEGVEQSYFAHKQRGELPEMY